MAQRVSPGVQQLVNMISQETGLRPGVIETQMQAENGSNGILQSLANWFKFGNNPGNIGPGKIYATPQQGAQAYANFTWTIATTRVYLPQRVSLLPLS